MAYLNLNKIKPRIPGLLLLILILVLWEVFSRTNLIDPKLFPPISEVGAAFFYLIKSGELVFSATNTLMLCFAGYLLACLIGISLGLVLGFSQKAYYLFEPLLETLRPIPSAAIIPVAIIAFGIGREMEMFVIFFGSIWPILINTISGVHTIDPVLVDTGKTFKLTKNEMLRKIIIPAALPYIATGMRISLAISLILAITVEMIAGGGGGLGFLILDYERSFRFPEMYAGILTLGGIGYFLNFLFKKIEDSYLFWATQNIPST